MNLEQKSMNTETQSRKKEEGEGEERQSLGINKYTWQYDCQGFPMKHIL